MGTGPFWTFELVAEARLHERLGIALLGGAGQHSGTGYASDDLSITGVAVNAGAEARYYVHGGFRGFHLGAEAYYFRFRDVIHYPAGSPSVYDFAGHAAGPFVGFKYVAWCGFTVDGHVGAAYVFMTESDAADHAGLYPLLDLKIGWSL